MLNDSLGFALATTNAGTGAWSFLDLRVAAAVLVFDSYTHCRFLVSDLVYGVKMEGLYGSSWVGPSVTFQVSMRKIYLCYRWC